MRRQFPPGGAPGTSEGPSPDVGASDDIQQALDDVRDRVLGAKSRKPAFHQGGAIPQVTMHTPFGNIIQQFHLTTPPPLLGVQYHTTVRANLLEATIPHEREDVPYLAKRGAALYWDPNAERVRLGGTVFWETFDLDAEAACALKEMTSYHDLVPELNCTCGFYGVPADRPDLVNQGHVDLLVQLDGKVVVAEQGYRAQYQLVLEAHVPEHLRCLNCRLAVPTEFAVVVHPTWVVHSGLYKLFPACRSCRERWVVWADDTDRLRYFTMDEVGRDLGLPLQDDRRQR